MCFVAAACCFFPAALIVRADALAEFSRAELDGWKYLADLLPNDAAIAFRGISENAPAGRAHFARAVALLGEQPRTSGNVERSRELFAEVVREQPGSDLELAARYYLGRIEQIHRSPVNPARATEIFRALLREHAGHPVADMAAPKLAILLLYERVDAEEREKRVRELDALLLRVRDAAAIRDVRLIIAGAFIRIGGDHARALPYYLAVLEGGAIERSGVRNFVMLQIAESARRLKKRELAMQFYRRFLEEFPRDNRASEIQRRLTALEVEADVR